MEISLGIIGTVSAAALFFIVKGCMAEARMKAIMKKEEERRRILGETIAEKNRREYDLIAHYDKLDFINQITK